MESKMESQIKTSILKFFVICPIKANFVQVEINCSKCEELIQIRLHGIKCKRQ